MYDLVIKGGTLLDPSVGVYEKKDIAISGGKIDNINGKISEGSAHRVIDASGLIVTPGFVDIHAHVAEKVTRLSIDAEENCLAHGTTTVVDAGSWPLAGRPGPPECGPGGRRAPRRLPGGCAR